MPGTALEQRQRCLWLLTVIASLGACLGAAAGCGPPPHGTIGAILGQQNDGRVFVRDTPADLGAAQAGLQPGDEILFIDGVQASSLSPERLSEVLGGPVGADVQLTVLRDGQVLRVTVTRTEARRYSGDLRDSP
ncbi:MAG TPA: PDZ domain-containing protein [Polyangiaceae bacterium]